METVIYRHIVSYRGVQSVTGAYSQLQGRTVSYRGVQSVTGAYIHMSNSPELDSFKLYGKVFLRPQFTATKYQ